MRRLIACLLACLTAVATHAQDASDPEPYPPPDESRQGQPSDEAPPRNAQREVFDNVGKIIGGLERLGPWEEHYGMMMNAVESVYQRNGWESEPDRFSLDLIREVEARPPTAIQERFDTVIGLFSDRYMLDEGQEGQLRNMIMQESFRMFAKHSGRIMSYAMEAIQTRASGEAFTPEQVQRLATLAEPIFLESRERMTTLAGKFMETLDPQQRELVQRDLEAANRRLDWVGERGAAWMRGEWSPAEWGLDNDPIQRSGEQKALARAAANAAATQPAGQPLAAAGVGEVAAPPAPEPGAPAPAPAPPQPGAKSAVARPSADPWARYVEAFIGKYKLNQEQGQRCWLIYNEVKPRADQVEKRGAERTAAAPADAERQSRKRDDELLRLFQQMSRRLERIPTTQQRRDAQPGELPPPVSGAAPSAAQPARKSAAPRPSGGK